VLARDTYAHRSIGIGACLKLAELSANAKIELDVLAKGVSAILEIEKQAETRNREITRREDNFTVWIVTLSTGAIAGAVAIPNRGIVKMSEAIFVFAFFVLSIISGVIYRWVLKQFDSADSLATLKKQLQLGNILVSMPRIEVSDTAVDVAKAQLKAILQSKDPERARLERTATNWKKAMDMCSFVPPLMFVLGVVSIIVVAAKHWEEPTAVKPVPQIKQSNR
jgi:hypothetical protein